MLPLFFFPLFNLNHSVLVTWDKNKENDLIGYKIYYGESSKEYEHEIFVGMANSYKITRLRGGQDYYFALTAMDSAHNESPLSVESHILIPGSNLGDNEDDDGGEDANNEDPITDNRVYNFPNPFKLNDEHTIIRYNLTEPGKVTIDIFNFNNELVKSLVDNEFKNAGEHTEDVWDGTNNHGDFVALGVYLCRLRIENTQRFIKIAVTK